MLPRSVLQTVQAELLNWQGLGMSVLEAGHRTPAFREVLEEAEHRLRCLLGIDSDYRVLFLGGAARTLFGMIPMNFLKPGEKAGYCVTGLWSQLAYEEAARWQPCGVMRFESIDQSSTLTDLSYLYYTPNETVEGIATPKPVVAKGVALIADMTSCLLTQPITVSDYDLIFAGAQKNIANAGMTVVIVRDKWVKTVEQTRLPAMFDFRTHIEHRSLYATPPTFNCYLALHMFRWMQSCGGVNGLYQNNLEKARRLYAYIDASSFYVCRTQLLQRSLINVCFSLPDAAYESAFIEQALLRGLVALQGHRTQGGLRASLYNAMPLEGVDALITFMQDFRSLFE